MSVLMKVSIFKSAIVTEKVDELDDKAVTRVTM